MSPAYDTASIYATLGEVDQTFAWLERAFARRSQILSWLPWDGAFEIIRADPRYADFTKRRRREPLNCVPRPPGSGACQWLGAVRQGRRRRP